LDCNVTGAVPYSGSGRDFSWGFQDIFFTREQRSYTLETAPGDKYTIKVINFAIADEY